MSENHVVVVGGGITGLSAAFFLKQAAEQRGLSIRCTVIEQDDRLGGKILTYRESGVVVEAGPDSLLARKPHGLALIRQLGVESEVVNLNPQAFKTFVRFRGRLIPLPLGSNLGIPTNLRAFAATPLLSASGKARALLDLVLPRQISDGDVSLGRFLRRRLGDELVDRLVEPLMAGIYAGKADDLSLLATFPQLADVEREHRSLILGLMRQRRRPPASAPGTAGRSVFVTLRDGLQTLVERLYDTLQEWASIHTWTRASELTMLPNGRYRLSVDSLGQRNTLVADAVILTVPAFAAAPLLRKLTPTAARLESIPYVSTATVALAYPRSQAPSGLDGSGFIVPRSEGGVITACTILSNKWPHSAPPDTLLVRCFVGRAGQMDALSLPDSDLLQAVRSELEQTLGVTGRPSFARITRWQRAMPQYQVGHLDTIQQVENAIQAAAPGVVLAGAGYRGIGVPDCIAQAQRASEQVVELLQGLRQPMGSTN